MIAENIKQKISSCDVLRYAGKTNVFVFVWGSCYLTFEIMIRFQEESEKELKISNNKMNYIFSGKVCWNYNLGFQNPFIYSFPPSLATCYKK